MTHAERKRTRIVRKMVLSCLCRGGGLDDACVEFGLLIVSRWDFRVRDVRVLLYLSGIVQDSDGSLLIPSGCYGLRKIVVWYAIHYGRFLERGSNR